MCMIDGGDHDSRGMNRSKMQRARKQHKCDECNRRITPGERYEYTFNKYEGTVYQYHTCEHCVAVRSWLSVTCSGWLWQGVLEDLEQHWNEEWELKSLYLGRAVAGIRRGWQRITGDGLMKVPREWTAMDLPFKLRQSYDKRTTAYSGAFIVAGAIHYTGHEYILKGDPFAS